MLGFAPPSMMTWRKEKRANPTLYIYIYIYIYIYTLNGNYKYTYKFGNMFQMFLQIFDYKNIQITIYFIITIFNMFVYKI